MADDIREDYTEEPEAQGQEEAIDPGYYDPQYDQGLDDSWEEEPREPPELNALGEARPVPENFDTYEEFQESLIDWKVSGRLREKEVADNAAIGKATQDPVSISDEQREALEQLTSNQYKAVRAEAEGKYKEADHYKQMTASWAKDLERIGLPGNKEYAEKEQQLAKNLRGQLEGLSHTDSAYLKGVWDGLKLPPEKLSHDAEEMVDWANQYSDEENSMVLLGQSPYGPGRYKEGEQEHFSPKKLAKVSHPGYSAKQVRQMAQAHRMPLLDFARRKGWAITHLDGKSPERLSQAEIQARDSESFREYEEKAKGRLPKYTPGMRIEWYRR